MPKKELAKGYTTGTCAQAATRAAMQMLFTGEKVEQVSVELPQGEKLQLDITDIQRKYTDRELPDRGRKSDQARTESAGGRSRN